jgi:NADP-dependent 3-hydroxy acid dehydrogenase YdfG
VSWLLESDVLSQPAKKAGNARVIAWRYDGPSVHTGQAIADAIDYAINQPQSVDVNEVIVRPTAQG